MAREAEEKERAAKAAKKARQEQEAKVQAQESSPIVTLPVASKAESTLYEAMDVTGMIPEPCCCSCTHIHTYPHDAQLED